MVPDAVHCSCTDEVCVCQPKRLPWLASALVGDIVLDDLATGFTEAISPTRAEASQGSLFG